MNVNFDKIARWSKINDKGIFNKVIEIYKQKVKRADDPYESVGFAKDDRGSKTTIIEIMHP